MTYSENFDLETSIEETNSFLEEQYNGVNIIKDSVRDLMSSAGLIIALLSLFQINFGKVNVQELNIKEISIFVAIVLYIFMIILSVFILSPIKVFTPIEINKESFKILFYNKSPQEILENKLENYLLAVKLNESVFKKASYISKFDSWLYIFIIIILVISFFIK